MVKVWLLIFVTSTSYGNFNAPVFYEHELADQELCRKAGDAMVEGLGPALNSSNQRYVCVQVLR